LSHVCTTVEPVPIQESRSLSQILPHVKCSRASDQSRAKHIHSTQAAGFSADEHLLTEDTQVEAGDILVMDTLAPLPP